MASRFLPSDIGASTPGSSFSTPRVFNGYQFRGALFGSGWENSSSDVREPAQEVARAYIDWRYEHEAKVLRDLVRVESIESPPDRPFINSNMSYPTRGHGFGYEQRNPFLGYLANASAVNSLPRQRQETGNFTGHENEVFSHYASSHNRDLRGIGVLRNMKLCRWSQANVERNFPIMKLPEADVENKLTAASRPESETPVNIPLRHCPEGSHEGKMPCYGSVNSGNVQIFHCPQTSITKKLPSDNHSVSEILIKANIYDQKEEKGWRKENLTNVSSSKVLYSSVNSESQLLHQLDNVENSSPRKFVCSNGTALPQNSKKRKRRRFPLRKSMKKKTHSALESRSSIPCEKAVEELKCSFSKVGSTSLCSVEAHIEGKKHNPEGGSSIATKGIKKVKDATKKFKDGMKKVRNVKRVSKRRNHDRQFWCKMCNVEGINETLMRNARRRFPLRKSMKKKTHSALETRSSIPCEKAVEELKCSFSKVGSTSLCSVEAHIEGKKHNPEGGSSIATKGIKKVKDATKKFKDGMKKVRNVKRVSQRRNHDRQFWCKMCNVEGINETLMLIHRNGKKHLSMLRKNHGAVLVVSSNPIDKETIVKRR